MKLGIFTTRFEFGHIENGISNNAFLLAKHMIERHGFDVTVFSPRFKGLKPHEEHENLTIERFDIKNIPHFMHIPVDANSIIKNSDFDIVHSYHYGYPSASIGLRTAMRNNVPHFFTPTFHHSRTSKIRSAAFAFYNLTEGRKILKNSIVMPYNNDEKKHLEKISKFTSYVLPSPIQDDIFYPKLKKSKKIKILYVGAMLPWKGAGVAFDICKEIEKTIDAKFIFIGSGPLENELKRKSGKNFVFKKSLSIKDLAEEYRSADLFLYPTAYESFGRVAAESMMSGTPVVTTKVGAMPETVGPGGALVDYGEWEQMKNNVLEIISDSRKIRTLSNMAIKHAKKYRTHKVCESVYNLYKKYA